MPGATIRSSSRPSTRSFVSGAIPTSRGSSRASARCSSRGCSDTRGTKISTTGFRPPGLFRLSETTIDNVALRAGLRLGVRLPAPPPTTSRSTATRVAPSSSEPARCNGHGASTPTTTPRPGCRRKRVNENTTRVGVDPNGPDRNVRQATVNLFADMGVQPATLAPGPRSCGSLRGSRAAGLAHRRAADRFVPAAGPGADLGRVARSRGWVASPRSRCRWTAARPGTPPRGARRGATNGSPKGRAPGRFCAGRSTTAATSKRPPRALPSLCQRRREGQGAVRPRARRHGQVMKIANVAARGMKSHGSKVRDWLRNNCPDEPPGVPGDRFV